MRKFGVVLLAVACMLQCVFAFSACNGKKSKGPDDLFNFRPIDEYTYLGEGCEQYLERGTYMIASLNRNKEIPKTLILPSEYHGVKVTALGGELLSFTNVETVVIPDTVKAVGANLCGSSCPMLGKIICMGYSPFYLRSFALDQTQLRGACKIYVPDLAINYYKQFSAGGAPLSNYADLIEPYSSLDSTLRAEIEKTFPLPSAEDITFTATFVANGETVATRRFFAYAETLEDEPEVPSDPCADYGYWEDYRLLAEDIVIHAVYIDRHHDFDESFHCTVCGRTPSEGDIVKFGNFEQDNDLENGKEVLEWLVLEQNEGKLMCITKYAIVGKYFTDSERDVKPWEECPLRIWLNTEFIDAAFQEKEKSMLLIEPRMSNGVLCSNDKVFLLNAEDTAFRYCPPNGAFLSQPTPYAISQGVSADPLGRCSCWLFASGVDQAAMICDSAGRNGSYANYVPHEIHGVRPVIRIDLSGD